MDFADQFDWTEGIENSPVYCSDVNLIKSHKHSKYVSQNIPGPGCNMDDFEDRLVGCTCQNCNDDCKCISAYGKSYTNSKIHSEFLCSSLKPIFECNTNCKCLRQCPNRVVQNGISVKLQLFYTDKKGFGLHTLERISKGSFVCEYAGEIISLEEAKRRSKLQAENDMNYILTVKEHCKNGILLTHVDPNKFGNIGRYINHSCDPNLAMVPVRIDNMVPKICLFASRDIEAMEELTFQYGTLNYKQNSGKACYCSSDICTGYLPFDEELKSE